MRRLLYTVALLFGAGLATEALAEPTLAIRDAALRVTVIPETRSDVQVQVAQTHDALPITVIRSGDAIVVQGRVSPIATGCTGVGTARAVRVGFVVPIGVSRLPHIIVRAPRDLVITASRGAVFGQIGPSQSLRLGSTGCGLWTISDVTGRLAVNSTGSGDIHAGRAGRAEITLRGSGDISLADTGPGRFDIAGSGNIRTGAIRGGVATRIAGSGDFVAASADGPMDLSIVGSGDAVIRQGRASRLSASIRGSGDVNFGGDAESLDASIMGSGDIRVRRVSGPVTQRVRGSGDVRIGS